ncbi:MAG: 50S ribosomal protein L13 [Candidatus Brocadiales bacterium]|nr:50S ribosomal protein L13 [Candidatus Bathyanammoxibius amoris]
MKTFVAKDGLVPKVWYEVNADGKVLGRMATRIATVLQGKHKPQYTSHVDTGDFVVVYNAKKVKLTGNKLKDKMYKRYTGYPSGLKLKPAGEMLEKHSDRVVRLAVKRMLPKSKLGDKMIKKLKIYAGPEHPHEAQQPRELTFN